MIDYIPVCVCAQGVMARVYETAVVLLLLTLLVLGMVWVASAALHHHTARESLYGERAGPGPAPVWASLTPHTPTPHAREYPRFIHCSVNVGSFYCLDDVVLCNVSPYH